MKTHARAPAGFTIIEVLVVVVIVGLLTLVAAPSFKRFIDVQRLRSINAALITDIQFARSEAASRNSKVVLKFDRSGGSVTCYVILTGDHSLCDCKQAPGSACSGAAQREIRTVQVPRETAIELGVPTSQTFSIVRFDPATGGIDVATSDFFVPPTRPFLIEVNNPSIGGFVTSIETTGRPSACSPSGQISGVPSCL